jgi:hypothetical protein
MDLMSLVNKFNKGFNTSIGDELNKNLEKDKIIFSI